MEKAEQYLKTTSLPPTNRNTLFTLKLCSFVGVFACTGFVAGVSSAALHQEANATMAIQVLSERINVIQQEQSRRTRLVYH